MCFNPRPPLPGGAARHRRPYSRRRSVSILAPRCRGAQPGNDRHRHDGDHVSILAPRCRGAQPMSSGRRTRRACFNPRPPLPGGAALRLPCSVSKFIRFNPRPPLPGGAAYFFDYAEHEKHVSILAPRCRGAQPFIFNSLSMQIFLPALRERRLERVVTSCFAALNQ
ncbi:hypothetical protein PROAA_520010 [Candidatus Propionivibrio aalborgensis]|uniref:Uncharacterized protein n=1 Tax=Candidatus Propionivibrio aalborgensis TaxID=1860101 RepID=A0A1A8Y012_9RHOO|nr:hypothetical protein PROAA_520010 [Candidatus Propionivibrio aalborgensis]